MTNSFFSAVLVDYNTIRIGILTSIERNEDFHFNLFVDGEDDPVPLKNVKQSFFNGLCVCVCKTDFRLELGKDYIVETRDFGMTPLNVNDATLFPDFDEDYYYDGDDLGATYFRDHTTFKLWAPLASRVSLFIKKSKKDRFVTYKMRRSKEGVYEVTLDGNYDGYLYRYQVTNSGITFLTTDPYAKASTANGKESAVVDPKKVNVDLKIDKLPKLNSPLDAAIYELHVRDFTIDSSTDIVNKGKFLGLTEEKRRTKGGNKAGLDYLKSLNVSHVQLLPIYDYKSVDELNPYFSYNWGYDPQQYFVPEGSFATEPNDPYSRIIELKKMIAKLHEAGLRVNMDVVFNHVYHSESSVFEKIVPNFYFRKNKNGTMCNGSGCGNDLATERPMVRKLVVDALVYWQEEYGIDGYRFDLMGLIDIDTLKLAEEKLRKNNKDIMLYGEGWDMYTALPPQKKATIYNSGKLPGYGYFNDSFRENVRGNNDLSYHQSAYGLGNTDYLEPFKFVLLSSSVNYCFEPRFVSPSQSINYVECHDNCTLFDKVVSVVGNDTKKAMKIINFVNFIVTFSFGIPFFHAGQEIGLTKFNEDNTYNKGDKYNKFNYTTLDERIENSNYFASIINARKAISGIYEELSTSDLIGKHNEFINLENGALMFRVFNDKSEYLYFFNPTENVINVELKDYYLVLVSNAGYLKKSEVFVRTLPLPAHSGMILVKQL